MSKDHATPPDGWKERSPEWHYKKFVEFTRLKGEIGEPSPHLAIVGHMGRKMETVDKLWLLGCYAATYCLPTAQVLWDQYPNHNVLHSREALQRWLKKHWPGIVTRTERRCVRTPKKMSECLYSLAVWMDEEYPRLKKELAGKPETPENYDMVWKSVSGIKFFGRYINIRFVEGLRRYHGIPAKLYDIRSIGGWSPKKCLCYLYPEHADVLLVDDAKGNELTDELAMKLLRQVQTQLPKVDEYILAAMLCEYKGAFENRHQYPGHTIDQEPDLYVKVAAYWGDDLDSASLWRARKALFPSEVLGEISGWSSYRHALAKTLRDHGLNWSDLDFNYVETLRRGDFSKPVRWEN